MLKRILFLVSVLLFFGILVFFLFQFDLASSFSSLFRGGSIKDLSEYSFYTEIQNNSTNVNYFKEWDYLTSYMVANISGIYYEDNFMDVTIKLPNDKHFTNVLQTIPVKCNPEDTVVVMAENFLPVAQGVDIYENSLPGDSLYTYCLNESCDSLGTSCVLVKVTPLESEIYE